MTERLELPAAEGSWAAGVDAVNSLTDDLVPGDLPVEEALDLADRVVIIHRGIVEQEGTADDVLERPATPFVKDFFRFVERSKTVR